MADGDLARMLQVITQKLENLEKKSEENDEDKAQQKTRLDAMSEMLMQASRKLNFLENEEGEINMMQEHLA